MPADPVFSGRGACPTMVDINPSVVLQEIEDVFHQGFSGGEELIQALTVAQKVVAFGAGRVGLATAAFAKRLGHLGKEAYWLNDHTVPRTEAGDLFLAVSGSGKTETVLAAVRRAKKVGLRIVLVTANGTSPMAEISDDVVLFKGPATRPLAPRWHSVQPMTSLFEQVILIFFDSVVLSLQDHWRISSGEMEERHNVIE